MPGPSFSSEQQAHAAAIPLVSPFPGELASPLERGDGTPETPPNPALAGAGTVSSTSSSNSAAPAPKAASPAPKAASPAPSDSGASSSDASSSESDGSSSAASSSPASSSSSDYSSSVTSSSPASSYASSPAASALEEGKAANATTRGPNGEAMALPGTPFSGKTLDSDITTLPITPFRKSCLCRCMAWSTAVLAVLGTIVGVLVQKRVIWFVMPAVTYEKGGSSFQLSAVGPAGEIGGIEYATDFYMQIGVKVENPNTYPLTFSDVSMALTDFRGAYVGTASHEAMVTVPAKRSKAFTLDAEIHTTLPEIMQIAADCEANGMTTEIKAAGSLRAQIVPNVVTIPIKMGPYKTTIECNVMGPDGKPIVGADGHIHLPDHLQEPTPAAEAPAAVAVDQPAAGGGVALEPVPADGAGAAPPAPPADGAAPPTEPGKDMPAAGDGGAGGGEGAGAPPAPPAPEQAPAPPAPPAGNNGGGGFLRNIFGWGS